MPLTLTPSILEAGHGVHPDHCLAGEVTDGERSFSVMEGTVGKRLLYADSSAA
jgi:hypothetical protein